MGLGSQIILKLADYSGYGAAKLVASPLVRQVLQAYRLAYWKSKLGAFGEGSHIYPHVIIHAADRVKIGKRVNIAEFVHIWGGGGVEIGDNVIIASHAAIASQTHDKYAPIFRDSNRAAPVAIEANCWIGTGAIILPGIRIGEGSILGAQAVVTADVPARSIVAGVPARLLANLEPNPAAVTNNLED